MSKLMKQIREIQKRTPSMIPIKLSDNPGDLNRIFKGAVLAATAPEFGSTIVLEGGETYAFNAERGRYMLTKRAFIDDDGSVVLKRAKIDKATKKAAKAIAKAADRDARSMLIQKAATGDPQAQRLLRELVTHTVNKNAQVGPVSDETILASGVQRSTREAARTSIGVQKVAGAQPTGGDGRDLAAKQVLADTYKGAFDGRRYIAGRDQLGLGPQNPPGGAGVGGFPTRPGTASVGPFMVRPGSVSAPTGITPQSSGAVDNADTLTNIYLRRFPQDAKGINTDSVDPMARPRQEQRDGGNPAGALGRFYSAGVEPVPLDTTTFQPIFNPNMPGAPTPTADGRNNDGGDLGSRSGSGRKKTNTPAAPNYIGTNNPVGVKQPSAKKAAKLDKKQRKIEKRVKKNAKKIAAAR